MVMAQIYQQFQVHVIGQSIHVIVMAKKDHRKRAKEVCPTVDRWGRGESNEFCRKVKYNATWSIAFWSTFCFPSCKFKTQGPVK